MFSNRKNMASMEVSQRWIEIETYILNNCFFPNDSEHFKECYHDYKKSRKTVELIGDPMISIKFCSPFVFSCYILLFSSYHLSVLQNGGHNPVAYENELNLVRSVCRRASWAFLWSRVRAPAARAFSVIESVQFINFYSAASWCIVKCAHDDATCAMAWIGHQASTGAKKSPDMEEWKNYCRLGFGWIRFELYIVLKGDS